MLTPKNARGRPVTKLCLALETFRRTDEGRVRDAKAFLGHFFPQDKGTATDRVFIHIPKEVRADLLSNWGIRGKKSALRDDDERVRTTVSDALNAGDIDAPVIEDGISAEILVDWVPLDDWWAFWRGNVLPVASVRKALALARDLSLFDEKWFFENLALPAQKLEGTDVVCSALSKEQIVAWVQAIHTSGDATPVGLVAAVGWETILAKTAHEALLYALDALARQIGLAEDAQKAASTRASVEPKAPGSDAVAGKASAPPPAPSPPSTATAAATVVETTKPAAETKTEAAKPTETPKPADVKAADAKSAATAKTETPKPADVKPADAKPAVAPAAPAPAPAPADAKPADAKVADAKPAEKRPASQPPPLPPKSAAPNPPPAPPASAAPASAAPASAAPASATAKPAAQPAAKPPPIPTKPADTAPAAKPADKPAAASAAGTTPNPAPTATKPAQTPAAKPAEKIGPVALMPAPVEKPPSSSNQQASTAPKPPPARQVQPPELPSIIVEPDPPIGGGVTVTKPAASRAPAPTPDLPSIIVEPDPFQSTPVSSPPSARVLFGAPEPQQAPPMRAPAPTLAGVGTPPLFEAAPTAAEVAMPSFNVPAAEPSWAPPRAEPGDMGWDIVYGVKRPMGTNVKPAYNFDDDDEPTSEIALPNDPRQS